MGVAVLQPQDCIREGVSHHYRRLISPPRSKPRRSSGTHNPSPNQTRSGRRKQWSPAGSPPPTQPKPYGDAKSHQARSPGLTGQVRILKRGEELTPTKQPSAETTPVKNRKTKREGSIERANSDPVVSSTFVQKSLEPAPAPIQNLVIGGFYAGSAFSTSPPPSSLPVPGFCTKSIGSCAAAKSIAEDVVAVDLRRMLRIE